MDRDFLINVSKDGGYNFSEQPRRINMGELGEYQDRINVMSRRFGHAKEFIFSFETTAPCRTDILAAFVDAEPLS